MQEAAKFFNEDPILGDFTFSDYQEFVSLWFFVIMTSDSLTIIGSIYKMSIDQKVRRSGRFRAYSNQIRITDES